MRTMKINDFTVGLKAVFGEYNCGFKTCGRLELVVTKGASKTNLGAQQINAELKEVKIRDQIVGNFLEDLKDSSTYKTLKDGAAEFWPTDSGTYPPGALIYIDSINYDAGITWYNNWRGLISLFETENKYGVVVVTSPVLPNRFYGTGKPSRIWTICLPSISEHICFDKASTSAAMKNSISNTIRPATPKHWVKEFKALGVGI